MRRSVSVMAMVLSACAPVGTVAPAPAAVPVMGDVNGDGASDVSDTVALESYLFRGGVAPVCTLGADVLSDGVVNLADSTVILSHTFDRSSDYKPFDAGACGQADPGRVPKPTRVGLLWDTEADVHGAQGTAL